MRIDKALNFVIPILRGEGDEPTLYVHAVPISLEVFEAHYLVLSKTWATLIGNGLDPRTAPSVAELALRDVAKSTPRGPGVTWWEGPDGVGGERGLLAELRRLSSAIVPTDDGWRPTPLDSAIASGEVTKGEERELMNLLAFFTVASHVPASEDRARLIRGEASMYDSLLTPLDSMNYAASLKTSTPADNTGRRSRPLSQPRSNG